MADVRTAAIDPYAELVAATINAHCLPAVRALYEKTNPARLTEFHQGFAETMVAIFNRKTVEVQEDVMNLLQQAKLNKEAKRIVDDFHNSECSEKVKRLTKAEERDPLVQLVCKFCDNASPGKKFCTNVYEKMVEYLSTIWGFEAPSFMILMSQQREREASLEAMRPVGDAQSITTNTTNSTGKKSSSRVMGFLPAHPAGERLLRQVCIRDLDMYCTMEDCVLEGELVSDPIVRTGVDSMLRDRNGEMIWIMFYNCLPLAKTNIGIVAQDRWDICESVFAKGTRVRIADPYFKLSFGNARMIRVDDPREVQLIPSNAVSKAWADDIGTAMAPLVATQPLTIGEARNRGNAAMKDGLFELALFHYKSCFRNAEIDEFVSLLLNRAKQQLQPKFALYDGAMADAACALVLRPRNQKAWTIYLQAVRNSGHSKWADKVAAARGINLQIEVSEELYYKEGPSELVFFTMSCTLLSGTNTRFSSSGADKVDYMEWPPQDANTWNGLGVAAHKAKDHPTANAHFSRALLSLGCERPLAAVFNNLALAALKVQRPLEALAYVQAAMRLTMGYRCADVRLGNDDSEETARRQALASVWTKAKARFVDTFRQLGRSGKLQNMSDGWDARAEMDGLDVDHRRAALLPSPDGKISPLVEHLNPASVKQLAFGNKVKRLIEKLDSGTNVVELNDPTNGFASVLPNDWVHPKLEIRFIPKKGRGVVTQTRVAEGTVLMVVNADLQTRCREEKDSSMFTEWNKNRIGDSCDLELLTRVLRRCAEDVPFALKMSHLYDGQNSNFAEEKSLDFKDLCDDYATDYLLPLLPPTPEHLWASLPDGVRNAVCRTTESSMRRMLNLNCHGSGNALQRVDADGNKRHKRLLVPIALLNHDAKPNCDIIFPHTKSPQILHCKLKTLETHAVLWAHRDIPSGSELTIAYALDGSDSLKSKWGIQ